MIQVLAPAYIAACDVQAKGCIIRHDSTHFNPQSALLHALDEGWALIVTPIIGRVLACPVCAGRLT